MKEQTIKALEFDKVVKMLSEHATSVLGYNYCQRLVPMTNLEDVVLALRETDEALTVLRHQGFVPLDGIFDISAHLRRSEIGGMLSGLELFEIASSMTAAKRLKSFLTKLVAKLPQCRELFLYCDKLTISSGLLDKLQSSISEQGEILDSASPNLKQFRQKLLNNEASARNKLETLVRSHTTQKMLSDAIVTIRNQRFVIPVKQEYRQHFGGIIHDQSASGQTLFIEPQAIVSLNNGLQDLKLQIQIEIEKILMNLTLEVATNKEELLQLVDTLGKLDFLFAKAKFGQKICGEIPNMNDQGIISLKRVKHPLLPLDEAVVNDIEIGVDYDAIVITGPNTGGKTVTLKTLGLCTLMAMAGLAICADRSSKLSVFAKVFADIGDEQSIEQNLSTFSSHMVNIINILDELDDKSLVLYDELGAGTDPKEGAALAIAILDETKKHNAKMIATTHYPELKAYGYNRKRVINVSVEFDVKTLSPTYRLLKGIPGKSNAFEICRKLGLSETLIESAKKTIGANTQTVENMIFALEQASHNKKKAEYEAQKYLAEVTLLKEEIELEKKLILENSEKLIEDAKSEALKIIEQAKAEAKAALNEIHKLSLLQKPEIKNSQQTLNEIQEKLEKAKPQKSAKRLNREEKKELCVGDDVRVLSFNKTGVLLEKNGANAWIVQLGIMKLKVSASDLEVVKEKTPPKELNISTLDLKSGVISYELDLRGERYDEALEKTEKFIDSAILANYTSVAIIHGHGTGALRTGVQKFLKKNRHVKSFRFGAPNEGGMGVTIVEL